MMTLRTAALLVSALASTGATAAGAQTDAAATASNGDPTTGGPEAVRPGNRSQAQDDERARGLVRIGEDGIARANDRALDAYFAKDFVYHGPGGGMNYEQLKANFAAMRAAFSGFAVERPVIIVKGDMVSARTTMTGTFTEPFSVAPYGVLAPTGRPIKLELINIFRYDANGKLAEEWVQSDRLDFLRQLGLELRPAG